MTHGLLSNSAVFLQNGSLSHYKALVNCWSSEKVGCTVFSMASVDGYLFFFLVSYSIIPSIHFLCHFAVFAILCLGEGWIPFPVFGIFMSPFYFGWKNPLLYNKCLIFPVTPLNSICSSSCGYNLSCPTWLCSYIL